MLQDQSHVLPELELCVAEFSSPSLVKDREVVCLVHFREDREVILVLLLPVFNVALIRELDLVEIEHLPKFTLI